MRVQITLDDDLVRELDRRVGARQRGAAITELVRRGLENERWDDIEAALAQIPGHGHDWDADPAAWVRAQRLGNPHRS